MIAFLGETFVLNLTSPATESEGRQSTPTHALNFSESPSRVGFSLPFARQLPWNFVNPR